jgi:hypothetical protein
MTFVCRNCGITSNEVEECCGMSMVNDNWDDIEENHDEEQDDEE